MIFSSKNINQGHDFDLTNVICLLDNADEADELQFNFQLLGNNSGIFLAETPFRVMFVFFGCYGRLSFPLLSQAIKRGPLHAVSLCFLFRSV